MILTIVILLILLMASAAIIVNMTRVHMSTIKLKPVVRALKNVGDILVRETKNNPSKYSEIFRLLERIDDLTESRPRYIKPAIGLEAVKRLRTLTPEVPELNYPLDVLEAYFSGDGINHLSRLMDTLGLDPQDYISVVKSNLHRPKPKAIEE